MLETGTRWTSPDQKAASKDDSCFRKKKRCLRKTNAIKHKFLKIVLAQIIGFYCIHSDIDFTC